MWEYEIKHKKNGKKRTIYGETVGNAFRKFGLDRELWVLIQKRELEDSDGLPRQDRTK